MRFLCTRRLCIFTLFILGFLADTIRSQDPVVQTVAAENWPQKVVVNIGDVRTRIDGPKLWTLSGIDYQDTAMATEDSAYGSVLTIRDVGHLGTAHFLDVPGKPGEVEKEQVTKLQLYVNEKPIRDFSPSMNLVGNSFLMERKSKIRSMQLETSVSIRDEVLIETVTFHATGTLDLRVAYPWMYALTPKATVYLLGENDQVRQRGTFLREGKAVSQVIENANWMAAFDPSSGKGVVCCFLKHPQNAEGSLLLIDAPGDYRKVAAYTLVDRIVPEGFAGTYQAAVGFFNATDLDWEEHAFRRASEIRALKNDR